MYFTDLAWTRHIASELHSIPDPRLTIEISVHGPASVGKSTSTRELQRILEEQGFTVLRRDEAFEKLNKNGHKLYAVRSRSPHAYPEEKKW